MTRSSAAIATSCRCAQATSRHRSKLSEQTYSRQFEHRQMIDLMQNVGEFEGTAIANELTHTCACACACTRAHPTTSDQLTNHVAVFVVWDSVPRHTSRHQRFSASNFHSVQWVINNCHRFPKPLWQILACLRPQKSDLTPSPHRPRIRGASPKYSPFFRPKEFCDER